MSPPRAAIAPADFKRVDSTKLCDKLSKAAHQTVMFFESKLQEDGSYGSDVKELACYFKSPMMFLTANKPHCAAAVLNYIKATFMTSEGDFKTSETLKSANSAYIEYWSYTNGWIVRAANQLEMKEVSILGSKYLSLYNLEGKIRFSTNQIDKEPKVTDVLTIAHHGLIYLEAGKMDIANDAGNSLCHAIRKQTLLENGFYLRLNEEKKLITDFPMEQAPFYLVSRNKSNQLYFMIGYPAAYLAILYKKTKNLEFLNAAIAYLNFALSCHKSVCSCDYSHKIAWAASLIYECTGEEKYLLVIDKIADHFIAKHQKDGMWFSDDINTSYDQSAEIACWFLDIVKNINNLKKS